MTTDEAASGGEPRPRRGERREQQRQRILDAARTVFFRDGFMPANLDEVAQRAGVAKGTLYRYFENKAELYVAVLSANGDVFERKMRETLVPDLDAAEQLRRLARFYVDHWTAHPEYFQIFWALENESVIGALPAPVVTQVTELWGKCLRLLTDVLEGGQRDGRFRPHDSWEVANVMWTLVNGLIQGDQSPAAKRLRERPLEGVAASAIELVLRGLDPSTPIPP